MPMRVSDAGVSAIAAHEGLRLDAYPDPGSVDGRPVTIGYGATTTAAGATWQIGDRITEAEAERLLRRDVTVAEEAVRRLVHVPLAQAQYDALTSFVFNVGARAFETSTLLERLNAGDYDGAAAQFGRWIYNDGRVMPGLQARRAAEAELFASASAGGQQPPAPITESTPTWEAPTMAPFLAAALPALVQAIPELIRAFGHGEVTERNAKAAQAVLQVVQTATGAPNAQAAVETIQSDPAALQTARAALERDLWFEATEAGGIAGAREFNAKVSDGNPLMMPALWISAALLVPVYAVVGAVIFGDGWSAEIRIQVVTAVLATMGIIGAFWLGSSFATTSGRKAQ
jgi:lysozyme